MLPIFIPNEYMYTEYARTIPGHAKMEKWEIYAHAGEDLIRTHGNFGKNEQQLREKVNLQQFVWKEKNEITVNGKTFYWPPRGEIGLAKSSNDSADKKSD